MSNESKAGEEEGRETILVGVDFSRAAQEAVQRAAVLSRGFGSMLVLLHVIDPQGLEEMASVAGMAEAQLRERIEAERRRKLGLMVESLAGQGLTPHLIVSWGHPFEQILRKAQELAVDLIVLGTAGRSADLEHALFGSTAERVLRAAPCPILCVPIPRGAARTR